MSYVVFARKWRPQTFDDIVGQEHAVTTLKNAIKSNRLAHAYIFAGPRGVGKTSCARVLAKSLNCQEGISSNPCNKCTSCIEITESRSFDVIEIDGASNRGIEEIRALRENVKFSPSNGRYKVYIIDEVHMLTTEAFNALLKTLEEPPAHVKFIFATTQPQKILATIISRCQFLNFERISNLQLIGKLKDIARLEKLKVDEDVFLAVAKASDGSLRDAESVLDELVSYANGHVRLKDVNSILGVVQQDFLFELVENIINKDASACINLLDKGIDEGKDQNQIILNLIEHYRNLMIVKVVKENHEKLLDLPKEVCQAIAQQAGRLSLDEIFLGFNVLMNSQEMARRIDSLRIPLEYGLVRLTYDSKVSCVSAQPRGKIPFAEVTKEIPGTESDNQAVKQETNAVSEDSAAIPGGKNDQQVEHKQLFELESIKQLWQTFMERLNKVKVSAAHYLESGRPVSFINHILTIEFPKKSVFHKEALESKENLPILESLWNELLSLENIKVNFALSQEEDAQEQEEDIDDPALKAAMATFNGRVVRKG